MENQLHHYVVIRGTSYVLVLLLCPQRKPQC